MKHIENITEQDKGLFSAMLGEAHQHIIAGLLLKAGFAVAAAPVRTGAYDLIVTAYRDRKNQPNAQVLLRAQCRTVVKSLKLIGGTRGGVDRRYVRPSPKEYKYIEQHNDLIIGIDKELDLYIVPTRFTLQWGKSVSVSRIEPLKWRFDLLLNWRDDYLNNIYQSIFGR
jgi:hypothetical protein